METVVAHESGWAGKRVLITGHTGFKGSWLAIWLKKLGAVVYGCALPATGARNLFTLANVAALAESELLDIRHGELLRAFVADVKPEIVFHLAAQSLVLESYRDPVGTYETNVIGTLNVLEAIRATASVKAAVIITTDKCYENRGESRPFTEFARLGGHDPYSSSKACAEILVASYRASFFHDDRPVAPLVATARAGNVVGGGDWSENRLVPDVIRAIGSGADIVIRNPDSIRPWQHVLESLAGYLRLGEALMAGRAEFERGWNFGPDEADAKPVRWVVEKLLAAMQANTTWVLDDSARPHEAPVLMLDSSDAKSLLGWTPRWNIEETIGRVGAWYRDEMNGEDALRLCHAQIDDYTTPGVTA